MLTVTKRFRFCYSHTLPGHKGKCCNLHGHNCLLEISIEDIIGYPKAAYPGMVMDFGDLKKAVNPLIEKLDHQHLNDVLPEVFLPATAENLCLFFLHELNKVQDLHGRICKIKVWETDDSYAEWRRE